MNRTHALDWLDGVHKAIAEAAGAEGATMRDYAATMLFAVIAPEGSVFCQIGDGAIVVSGAQGDWRRVFEPERGMYVNETYFVTQDDASGHLQFVHRHDAISEVALFTDGLERLLLDEALGDAHAPVFEKMFGPIRATTEAGKSEGLSEALAIYLGSPAVATRTDDDVTLLIAARRT